MLVLQYFPDLIIVFYHCIMSFHGITTFILVLKRFEKSMKKIKKRNYN